MLHPESFGLGMLGWTATHVQANIVTTQLHTMAQIDLAPEPEHCMASARRSRDRESEEGMCNNGRGTGAPASCCIDTSITKKESMVGCKHRIAEEAWSIYSTGQ